MNYSEQKARIKGISLDRFALSKLAVLGIKLTSEREFKDLRCEFALLSHDLDSRMSYKKEKYIVVED